MGAAANVSEGTSPLSRSSKRNFVHHGQRSPRIHCQHQGAPVVTAFHAVGAVAHVMLHLQDLEAAAVARLGANTIHGAPEKGAVGAPHLKGGVGRYQDFLGQGGVHPKASQDVPQARPRLRLRQRLVEEEGVAAVVDDFAGNSVDLPQRLHAHQDAATGPGVEFGLQPRLVGEGELCQLQAEYPGGGDAADEADVQSLPARRLGLRLHRAAEAQGAPGRGEEVDLPLPLHQPDGKGGLASPDIHALPGAGGCLQCRGARRGRKTVDGGVRGGSVVTGGGGCRGEAHMASIHGPSSRRVEGARGTVEVASRQAKEDSGQQRRHPDSNRGMRVLQTLALPLGDGAGMGARL